jgi:Mrp family chromosome partitioning ATPase
VKLKLKHIIIIGLVAAGLQNLFDQISKKRIADIPESSLLKVQARSVSASTFAAPIVAANWRGQLNSILVSSSPTPVHGATLAAMLPSTPAEGQVDVAQHAGRLLPDSNFTSFGSQMTNAATPAAVRRVVFADLLTRPNSIKVPWLIEVASSPVDNQSGEALHLLRSILREDYGTDWNAWRTRAAVWVLENP